LAGKIWFLGGDVIDAEVGELRAEEAFRRILAWKTGSFEILPAEPNRTRTIFVSYQGLLLESAQALDEAQAGGSPAEESGGGAAPAPAPESPLAALTKFSGVEFVVHVPGADRPFQARGVENPEKVAIWIRRTMQQLRALGEGLGAGQLSLVECLGAANNLAISAKGQGDLCVGFSSSISTELMRDTIPRILEKWDS
jgi:hypothetical protein